MSITAVLADEDEWWVARSDRPHLTLLIHSVGAKYALINKLVQRHECSLITYNTNHQKKKRKENSPLATFSQSVEMKKEGEGTYLAEADPEGSSAQPPCRRAGLGGGPWNQRACDKQTGSSKV